MKARSNKRRCSLILVFLCLLLSGCDHDKAPMGDDGGFSGEAHGGNPSIKAKIDDARLMASRILRGFAPELIATIADEQVRDFVQRHRDAWAEDIENSAHWWPSTETEEAQWLRDCPPHLRERAAVTMPEARAQIKFSWTVAEQKIDSFEDAVDVVLHESVHHLAETDETRVKMIVSEVMKLWKTTRKPDVAELKTKACERLAEYYLLAGPELREFNERCPRGLSLNIQRFSTAAPYDVVIGAEGDFTLDPMKLVEGRTLDARGLITFTKNIPNRFRLRWEAWRVEKLGIQSTRFFSDVQEYYGILADAPRTFDELIDTYPGLLVVSYRQGDLRDTNGRYLGAFVLPSQLTGSRRHIKDSEDCVVYYTSETGKRWPVAFRAKHRLQAPQASGEITESLVDELLYASASDAAAYVDREPASVEGIAPRLGTFDMVSDTVFTFHWNHVGLLEKAVRRPGTEPRIARTLIDARALPTHVLEKLRELRMAAIKVPDLYTFEDLVGSVKFGLIVPEFGHPFLRAEHEEELLSLYAQYFLRRARLNRGDGIIEFLNYAGGHKKILAFGLTQAELTFLVYHAYARHLESAHKVPVEHRGRVFRGYLEMLGWTMESLGVTPDMIERLSRGDRDVMRRFRFYDAVQQRLHAWRSGEEEFFVGDRWEGLQREIAAISHNHHGITLADVGLGSEILHDAKTTRLIVEAEWVLTHKLLPILAEDEPDLEEFQGWYRVFRHLAEGSTYGAEYLLAGIELPALLEPPERNGGAQFAGQDPDQVLFHIVGFRNWTPEQDWIDIHRAVRRVRDEVFGPERTIVDGELP